MQHVGQPASAPFPATPDAGGASVPSGLFGALFASVEARAPAAAGPEVAAPSPGQPASAAAADPALTELAAALLTPAAAPPAPPPAEPGLTEVSALLGQGKPRAEGEDLASALLPGPASPPPSDAAASGPGGPETAGASVPGGSSPALAFRATQPSPQSEEPEASGEALRDPAELPRPEGPRQEAGAAHDAGGRVLRAVVATGRAPSAPSLLEQVRFVLQPDLNQARVRLDPPGLGNLLVDVREVEGELSAQIQVERPEVLREIERLLPQLHEAFLRNGQALTRIEVSLNLQGFTDADAQGHEQQPSSGWERDEALSTPPPPSLAGPARALSLRLAPRAGLDTLA